MSTKPDGGPAFPAPDYVVDSARLAEDGFQRMGQTIGMTLRDYFEANVEVTPDDIGGMKIGALEKIAGYRYPGSDDPVAVIKWNAALEAAIRGIKADAMLAEREK